MRKKLLFAILGSPNKNGVTAEMLDCTVKAAIQNGWEVKQINLYEMNLGFCNGCRVCVKNGQCVQKDDIQVIGKFMQACDAVVLAAPVYWANVPAVVKNMFDRLLGIALEQGKRFPKPRFKKRQKYIVLTACNSPLLYSWISGQGHNAVQAMHKFFRTSGMKYGGKFVCTNAEKRGITERMKRRLEKYWQ